MALHTKRIVFIGECMVEMAPAEGTNTFRAAYAGDSFNTAWYLKQLRPQWVIDYVSCVGTDVISRKMCDFIENSGVGTRYIARLPEHTVGLYMVHLDQGERSFAYWRGQSAARELMRQPGLVEDAITGADIVYLSGISVAILDDAGRTALLDVLRSARATGVEIAFDSNLRPRLWPSTDAMCAAVMEFASVSDYVFPSHDEEALYFGDVDIYATQARYAQVGCKTTIVKNGGGEIAYAASSGEGTFRPMKASAVRDTTAAGDSFNAGFLAASGDMAKRIAVGCTLASRVIQGAGALVEGAAQALD